MFTTPRLSKRSPTQTTFCHTFFQGKWINEGKQISLNCSFGKHDEDLYVLEMRSFLKQQLPFHHQTSLLLLKQEHTSKVIDVDKPFTESPIADGMVTQNPFLLLGLQTADCMPILLCDAKNEVIGACHAGWKGLSKGIIQNTLHLMIEKGADPFYIEVAIGPCISQSSYEVGEEVKASFQQFPDAFIPWCHHKHANTLVSYGIDLRAIAVSILKEKGIQKIDISPIDTYQDPLFFSYRKATHSHLSHEGNQLSVIGMFK